MQEGVLKNALAAEQALQHFHINRKKVKAVQEWLKDNPDHDVRECPQAFTPGRAYPGTLTLNQRKDLLKHVEIMQRSNCTFTAKDVQKAMWRFYMLNIGAVRSGDALDWSEFEQYEREKNMVNVYKHWLAWVKSTQPKSMQVLNRKVIGVKGERAASCCHESVAAHFDALEALLVDIGVCAGHGATVQNPHRVRCCDEKGMTDESGKLKFVRSLSIKSLGAPSCSAGQSSFKHVSVLPFMCLDGRVSEPYVAPWQL